ncbi:DNA adenine methylase [Edwardsiella ictaluri]|uniref:D12 class N6 adenine-specific DNA methyltransferase, putative n=2 Tax=Edwardsiella ictaluri TaxID=67780 RepID=C5BER1_EDWI9|nr:DNA adenine methylase [Edwardsiella ictaluri]ACR70299.1 D12 class N6 adenine-specific DNA methyltransferase, putative [Edwardsiella ictaluri 93-146]AVZ82836.1 DNA adenine methylase [Edwardsiella ictaluri]EKS7762500.1 DNA adenine methylase [Edwardsiella ictaluri]EKS7770450.1 DNA adenine methylase [Edwardsiella ictaluri]EKS7773592.1 DNA adenine methylase [Edwardsiella ictaluri]
MIKHPAIRYHSGKWRLAPWIISHFPAHKCYVEPFGGAASVLLRKPRSYAEVYNDLDGDVVNLFAVLRIPQLRKRLVEACNLTPYSRTEFISAYRYGKNAVEQARRLVIRATMGFGSAGATKGTTGFRLDTKRTSGTAQHIWSRMPDNLAAVGQRFEGVLVENQDAIQCMLDHDAVDTLHFVDPPYVHSTRNLTNKYYRYEMDDADHQKLLETVMHLKGHVVICGYDSELYNDLLAGWRKETKQSAAAGKKGSVLRTECVWLSPSISTP